MSITRLPVACELIVKYTQRVKSRGDWFQFDIVYLTRLFENPHYNAVIMGAIASQITSLTIVYSIVYSDADQRKHQSSASLAFVSGNSPGPLNSPHKWPVTRKMFHLITSSWIDCYCRVGFLGALSARESQPCNNKKTMGYRALDLSRTSFLYWLWRDISNTYRGVTE